MFWALGLSAQQSAQDASEQPLYSVMQSDQEAVKSKISYTPLVKTPFGKNSLRVVLKADENVSAKLFVISARHAVTNYGAKIVSVGELDTTDGVVYDMRLGKEDGFKAGEFGDALAKNGLLPVSSEFDGHALNIDIDANSARLISQELKFNQENFIEPFANFIILQTQGAASMQINTKERSSTWLPIIYGYDRNFNQIFKVEKREITQRLNITLNGAQYLFLGDVIDAGNIKGGLVINLNK